MYTTCVTVFIRTIALYLRTYSPYLDSFSFRSVSQNQSQLICWAILSSPSIVTRTFWYTQSNCEGIVVLLQPSVTAGLSAPRKIQDRPASLVTGAPFLAGRQSFFRGYIGVSFTSGRLGNLVLVKWYSPLQGLNLASRLA